MRPASLRQRFPDGYHVQTIPRMLPVAAGAVRASMPGPCAGRSFDGLCRALVVSLLLPVLAPAGDGSGFPEPFNSGGHPGQPSLSHSEALAALELPAGFRATLFAGEPDVQNPVAMAWDARGRLWIAENYTYAERAVRFDLGLRDRVLVFEDANGDGRFSSRRVFVDDVQRLASVEVGRGGVWLLCPPQLLFVPDRDEDGVADGLARVVLDGFSIATENYHTFANGLRFGPDGWLYGRCGSASAGEIGRPGAPSEERVPLRGSFWRYHPDRRVFEALASGTTNPWGHDWDAHGELFFINTVNGHLWHGITGAHYTRPNTLDPNPHVYSLIDTHADHWHFDTALRWTDSRDGAANAQGGGHAHSGAMIYQGDNWPESYRGRLFTLNFHGRRFNEEILERAGSGYVGRHGRAGFVFGDPWFRGIDLASGPDGGVFVLDWSDVGECHNSTGVSRTSGRIYKIVHGAMPPALAVDLPALDGSALVDLHRHPNVWFARQARLQLVQRAAAGGDLRVEITALRSLLARGASAPVRLQALWTLHGLGAATHAFLAGLLYDADEHVRTWAVRLLADAWPLDTVLSERPAGRPEAAVTWVVERFVEVARQDDSALVRLALASTLKRLPANERARLAEALVARQGDATDHNLPSLVWYGLIPLGADAPQSLAAVAADSAWPLVRRHAARRLASDLERDPRALAALLAYGEGRNARWHGDVLTGMTEAFFGWRTAAKPPGWEAFAARAAGFGEPAIEARVRDLNVLFGDGRALEDVRRLVLDPLADMAARKAALSTLIGSAPPDLRELCESLLRVRFLNVVAVRGLVRFDDPEIGRKIATAYGAFHASDRPAVIDALASRPSLARALLERMGEGRIPREAITPFHARQIRGFADGELQTLLAAHWGELREAASDKAAQIEAYRAELTAETLAAADKSLGRGVYNLVCASCHKLYGDGVALGPDLTGSGRHDLDYLLENVIDPGAVVTADYRMSVVTLKDGRVLNGFISERTERTLTIRGLADSEVVERSEVASLEQSSASIMPEGLFDVLTPEQRRDLIAYLMHPVQVPLPP